MARIGNHDEMIKIGAMDRCVGPGQGDDIRGGGRSRSRRPRAPSCPALGSSPSTSGSRQAPPGSRAV